MPPAPANQVFLVTAKSEHGNRPINFIVIDKSPSDAREQVLQSRMADGGVTKVRALDLNKTGFFPLS